VIYEGRKKLYDDVYWWPTSPGLASRVRCTSLRCDVFQVRRIWAPKGRRRRKFGGRDQWSASRWWPIFAHQRAAAPRHGHLLSRDPHRLEALKHHQTPLAY